MWQFSTAVGFGVLALIVSPWFAAAALAMTAVAVLSGLTPSDDDEDE